MGVVSGYEDGRFRPDDQITREQFVKLLITAFDLQDDSADCNYVDVNQEQWYYKYIASAKKIGLVNGESDTSFGIGKSITRQNMAELGYRILVYKNIEVKQVNEAIKFNDALEIDEDALPAVSKIQQAGIINGVGDGNFNPKGFATRAQACKIIYNILKLSK